MGGRASFSQWPVIALAQPEAVDTAAAGWQHAFFRAAAGFWSGLEIADSCGCSFVVAG